MITFLAAILKVHFWRSKQLPRSNMYALLKVGCLTPIKEIC